MFYGISLKVKEKRVKESLGNNTIRIGEKM
jgi:hypothetical protein